MPVQQNCVNDRIYISPQELKTSLLLPGRAATEDEFRVGHICWPAMRPPKPWPRRRREQAPWLPSGGEDFSQAAVANSAGQRALEGAIWDGSLASSQVCSRKTC